MLNLNYLRFNLFLQFKIFLLFVSKLLNLLA